MPLINGRASKLEALPLIKRQYYISYYHRAGACQK